MSPKHQCRCCGAQSLDEAPLGSYEICNTCGWEDDSLQSSDPDYAGGANRASMNQYRQDLVVEQAQQELWRAKQHGSPAIRIELAGSGAVASLEEAASWMSDAVSSGAQVHILATCEDPPDVVVRIARSVLS